MAQDEITSRTHKLKVAQDKISGFTDELDAIAQAVYLILSVEKFEYEIYSWKYGVKFSDLFGTPASQAIPEIKNRIRKALLYDDRINAVEDFSFSVARGKVHTTFTVHSVFGNFKSETVVNI